jgi:hypothetical protein
MFEKLAARVRSSDTDFRLLVPLLISTMLVQLVTAMVRAPRRTAPSSSTCRSSGSV